MSGTRRLGGEAALDAAGGYRTPAVGVLLAAALGVLVVTFARWGPDWPAQEFRGWIAVHDGLSVFTTRWYSGAALPGYSVLYPVLAAVLSPALLGIAACVLTTWAAADFAKRLTRPRATVFEIAIAVATAQNLLIGQIPFLIGTAFAALAIRALFRQRHPALVATASLLAALASPLAGGFVVLLLPSLAMRTGWRRSLALLPAATGAVVAALVGGASGPFPFPWQVFVATLAFCGAVPVLTRRDRAMIVFAMSYALAAIAVFVVPNAVGGNIERLAKLIALPLACYFVPASINVKRVGTVLVAVATAVLPSVAFFSSFAQSAGDPSRNEQFYAGLVRYLHHSGDLTGRLEVPFTRDHWEAYFVARQYPIARGWERQSDLEYNAVLYHPLTSSRYRRWLSDNAVSLVALPNVPMDAGGQAEATLLSRPPHYLVPVWQNANWQVWRVRHPTPLVTGARLVDEDSSSLRLRFASAGSATVRIRASDLWQTQTAGACVSSTPTGWLVIRARSAGIVDAAARLNSTVLTGASRCRA